MKTETEKLRRRPGQGPLPLPTAVEQSWRRCLEDYNLVPDVLRVANVMTSTELREARDRHETTLRVAAPEIERLFRWLGGEDCLVSLGSPEAIKLMFRCNDRFLGDLSAVGVLPGSIWDEALQGTNGMGTCLAADDTISILGDQHFSSKLMQLTCIATPIRGEGGTSVGVVNVTSMRPTDPETTRRIRDATLRTARRIEHQTFALQHERSRVFLLSESAEPADPAAEARLAADDRGRIIDVTSSMAGLLGWDRRSLIGTDIDDFLLDARFAGRDPSGQIRLAGGRSVFLRPLARSGPVGVARPARSIRTTAAKHLLLQEALVPPLGRAAAMLDEGLPIVVEGESGTGKSVLAQMLARREGRPEGNSVVLNCAMPDVEAAQTLRQLDWLSNVLLVLDRAEDMSPGVQQRLLQFLPEEDLLADRGVSLLCLTTRDLAIGEFRGDLYHRLNGAKIALSPLRVSPMLSARIAQVFAQEATARGLVAPEIDETARLVLASYHWPGNLRELRHAVRHALALAGCGPVRTAHLPEGIVTQIARANLSARSQAERSRIEAALKHNSGNVSATARYLGMSRATLYRKLGGIDERNRR